MTRRHIVSTALVFFVAGCAWPRHAGPRLAHFEMQAPIVGAQAPPFELHDCEGRAVRLDDLTGTAPVVLLLGSYSCPILRYRSDELLDLRNQYAGRARFVFVYTREAHPVGSASPYTDDEWDHWANRLTGVRVEEPRTLTSKTRLAIHARDELSLGTTVLVDDVESTVWNAYGRAPAPAFVIAADGRVVCRQVWFDPDGLRDALDRLVGEITRPGRRGPLFDR